MIPKEIVGVSLDADIRAVARRLDERLGEVAGADMDRADFPGVDSHATLMAALAPSRAWPWRS